MAHTLTIWLGRFLSSAHPPVQTPPTARQPMKIEVERLPDYLWQDLGFPQPGRPEEGE